MAEAARWHEQQRPRLGADFLRSIESSPGLRLLRRRGRPWMESPTSMSAASSSGASPTTSSTSSCQTGFKSSQSRIIGVVRDTGSVAFLADSSKSNVVPLRRGPFLAVAWSGGFGFTPLPAMRVERHTCHARISP